MSEAYLKVTGLKTFFNVKRGLFSPRQVIKAVNGVSFGIPQGKTLGIVGESGCGKSTLARTIVRIYDPVEGSVEVNGIDIAKLRGKELTFFRREVQMVFQDPYASLDPRMTVGEIIREPMKIHGLYPDPDARDEAVVSLLARVGLKADHIRRYPHEFSGGQRQRISIARTLATSPKCIVADEPISALDVSIQAQIVNLLKDIQRERNLTYMFIAHDIGMVKHISDEIGVMYLGRMVEIGPGDAVFFSPVHPYTKALLSAIPAPDPDLAKSSRRVMLTGEIPSPANAPAGCAFADRCPVSGKPAECRNETPPMREVNGRMVACWKA